MPNVTTQCRTCHFYPFLRMECLLSCLHFRVWLVRKGRERWSPWVIQASKQVLESITCMKWWTQNDAKQCAASNLSMLDSPLLICNTKEEQKEIPTTKRHWAVEQKTDLAEVLFGHLSTPEINNFFVRSSSDLVFLCLVTGFWPRFLYSQEKHKSSRFETRNGWNEVGPYTITAF